MHVAIPFYMDTISTSFGRPERMWGRAVANHGFVRALASAAPAVRLTIFVPTRRDVGILRSTLLDKLPQPVNVVPFGQIAAFLTEDPIDVLHVLDPNMWVGTHIRNRLAPAPFVVTGMTHSLANEHFLNWVLLNNANGVHANDCLVCTTPSAKGAVDTMLARLVAGQPGLSVPQTTVIPLGMSLDAVRAPSTLRRVELSLEDDDFVILSFSRFNPEFKMDLLPLLNLLTLLAGKVPRPVRLVLAGAADNGAYARFLQDQVRDRGLRDAVRFVLDVSDGDKHGLYEAADVFLSLSDNIQETFGLTVVEAMAAGLPVVASDWDGYKALVQDGTTGFLVPTRTLPPDRTWEDTLAIQLDSLSHMFCAQTTAVDLSVAADRLAQLGGDRDLARRMGAAASASVTPLAWETVIARYQELWTRLREAGPSTPRPSGDAQRSSALAFLGDFAGYASAPLSAADRFTTSKLGQGLLTGKSAANIYDHLDEFLDWKLMQQLLREFSRGKTVGDMISRFQGEPGHSATRISQNILWLYKYGYLAAVPG